MISDVVVTVKIIGSKFNEFLMGDIYILKELNVIPFLI
jgi:hypothetical protein